MTDEPITTTVYRVTDAGLTEIAEIIEEHGKYPATENAVNAYAEDVERNLGKGAGAYFEIREIHAKHGNAMPFTISDHGWEAVEKPLD